MSEGFSGDLGKLDRALVRRARFPRLTQLRDGDPARSFHFTQAPHSNYFATSEWMAQLCLGHISNEISRTTALTAYNEAREKFSTLAADIDCNCILEEAI